MSLPADIARFIANNPALVTRAVDLTRALIEGRSGARELGALKRGADAERERRRAIAAISRQRDK